MDENKKVEEAEQQSTADALLKEYYVSANNAAQIFIQGLQSQGKLPKKDFYVRMKINYLAGPVPVFSTDDGPTVKSWITCRGEVDPASFYAMVDGAPKLTLVGLVKKAVRRIVSWLDNKLQGVLHESLKDY